MMEAIDWSHIGTALGSIVAVLGILTPWLKHLPKLYKLLGHLQRIWENLGITKQILNDPRVKAAIDEHCGVDNQEFEDHINQAVEVLNLLVKDKKGNGNASP